MDSNKLQSDEIESKNAHGPLIISIFLKSKNRKFVPVYYIHGSVHIIRNWSNELKDLIPNIKANSATITIGENFGNKENAKMIIRKIKDINQRAKKLYGKYLTDEEIDLYNKNRIFDTDTIMGLSTENHFIELYPELASEIHKSPVKMIKTPSRALSSSRTLSRK